MHALNSYTNNSTGSLINAHWQQIMLRLFSLFSDFQAISKCMYGLVDSNVSLKSPHVRFFF